MMHYKDRRVLMRGSADLPLGIPLADKWICQLGTPEPPDMRRFNSVS